MRKFKLMNSSMITPSGSNIKRIIANESLPKTNMIVNISKMDETILGFTIRNDINKNEIVYDALSVDDLLLNPIDLKYKTCVLHIMGSNNGKANNIQVKLLSKKALENYKPLKMLNFH